MKRYKEVTFFATLEGDFLVTLIFFLSSLHGRCAKKKVENEETYVNTLMRKNGKMTLQ